MYDQINIKNKKNKKIINKYTKKRPNRKKPLEPRNSVHTIKKTKLNNKTKNNYFYFYIMFYLFWSVNKF